MIALHHLLNAAALLRSEEGENPEYDRALVELIHDVTGFDHAQIARRLDLRGESLRRQADREKGGNHAESAG